MSSLSASQHQATPKPDVVKLENRSIDIYLRVRSSKLFENLEQLLNFWASIKQRGAACHLCWKIRTLVRNTVSKRDGGPRRSWRSPRRPGWSLEKSFSTRLDSTRYSVKRYCLRLKQTKDAAQTPHIECRRIEFTAQQELRRAIPQRNNFVCITTTRNRHSSRIDKLIWRQDILWLEGIYRFIFDRPKAVEK